jgi:hypothetical protein
MEGGKREGTAKVAVTGGVGVGVGVGVGTARRVEDVGVLRANCGSWWR